jgi:hypothetical protein
MQVEPFYATRILVRSNVFHNQSECGTGKQVLTRGHGVTGDVSDKIICARCAAIAKSMAKPAKATKKSKKKKGKKKKDKKSPGTDMRSMADPSPELLTSV